MAGDRRHMSVSKWITRFVGLCILFLTNPTIYWGFTLISNVLCSVDAFGCYKV